MELSGSVAIVTGAAVRIGRAVALALAEAGCNVLVHYGTSEDEAEATADDVRRTGQQAETVAADLARPAEAADAVFDACRRLGRPSLLVNSAAIFEPGGAADTSDDNWDRHLAINLSAPFHLMRRFAEHRDPDEPAHVVNIADWRAERHPAGQLAYTVSKSGLLALTRVAAQDLAPHVRVNAIAPGPILPPPGMGPEAIAAVVEKLPLRRQGRPEEIAAAVVWLSEQDFITGEMLHVDGGQRFTGGL